MGTPLIKAEKLIKRYGGAESAPVLAGIDLEIESGDFTVIMGSSGAGKSTLLYCLSGMDSPSAGSVKFLDQELTDMRENGLARLRREHIGFVFQQINLLPQLSLLENITVAGYLVPGVAPAEVHRAAWELLSRTGLQGIAHRLPAQVSGGEQQRVGVARALVNTPTMLFADEPTGSLNSDAGTRVLNMLSAANVDDAQAILMVTHDVKAALRADRILYISDGRIRDEKRLPRYGTGDLRDREAAVVSWLSGLGW